MSSPAIRAAIVTLLAGIPDIGNVHAFERYADQTPAMLTLYAHGSGKPKQIRGWFVRRRAWGSRLLPSGRTLIGCSWSITGYLSIVDAEASELAADALVDAIEGAFATDPTLGGLVRGVPVNGRAPLQLAEFTPVMFAGVLCHRITLDLITEHYVPATSGTVDDGLAQFATPAWRLISEVVSDLRDALQSSFATVEGRLAFDQDDDPATMPAAIVVPLEELGSTDPTTTHLRDHVAIGVGVIVLGGSAYAPGDGAKAADGLAALRGAVRTVLHGWGDGSDLVDVPLLYRGAISLPAPAGRVAWRDTYQAVTFVEPA